jgi:predicted dehydrogenase
MSGNRLQNGSVEMLRIAVVGTGWWGMELGKAAHALPGKLEIKGCHSLSAKECGEFQRAFGGKVFGSFEEILADTGVDAVLLATPHSTHWTQIIQAAKAKKHVFCEKPLALSVETASRAVRACADEGVVLAVGHNRRYGRVARKMKSMIDAGECGKVIHVEANYSGNVEGRYPKEHWRVQQDEIPAGGLTPMGLHVIDTLTWILGPIARVVSIAKHQALSYALHDTCATLFELESGVTGLLASHLACPNTSILRIYGTRANIEARNNFSEFLVEPADAGLPKILERHAGDDTLQQELTALDEACKGGAAFPIKPMEAVRNIAVLEAIKNSAAAGSVWTTVSVRG